MNHACAGPLRNFSPMKNQHPCTSFCDELNLSSTCYLQQPPVVSAICIFSPTLPIGLKIYFNLILHIILHSIYFGRTIVTNKEKKLLYTGHLKSCITIYTWHLTSFLSWTCGNLTSYRTHVVVCFVRNFLSLDIWPHFSQVFVTYSISMTDYYNLKDASSSQEIAHVSIYLPGITSAGTEGALLHLPSRVFDQHHCLGIEQ